MVNKILKVKDWNNKLKPQFEVIATDEHLFSLKRIMDGEIFNYGTYVVTPDGILGSIHYYNENQIDVTVKVEWSNANVATTLDLYCLNELKLEKQFTILNNGK